MRLRKSDWPVWTYHEVMALSGMPIALSPPPGLSAFKQGLDLLINLIVEGVD